jgi:hypothetical protein
VTGIGEQGTLLDAEILTQTVKGVPAGRFDPAVYDAALAGDGYGWLARLLPAAPSPACQGCARPMSLPSAAPVLWACPACHPGEAS